MVTLGSGTMLALEGGIVRGVRRDAGGAPRSAAGTGNAAAAAAAEAETRTPGAHLRVSFARPDHPIAYGYPASTYVFRQNYPLYALPRRSLQMAYCQGCLDGPYDLRSVVLEWGDRDGAPLLVSGQVWGEAGLIGRPAIFDLPEGRGHVIAFNFNPLHRDLNRGDQRMLWNALLNWQAIVHGVPAGGSAQRKAHEALCVFSPGARSGCALGLAAWQSAARRTRLTSLRVGSLTLQHCSTPAQWCGTLPRALDPTGKSCPATCRSISSTTRTERRGPAAAPWWPPRAARGIRRPNPAMVTWHCIGRCGARATS